MSPQHASNHKTKHTKKNRKEAKREIESRTDEKETAYKSLSSVEINNLHWEELMHLGMLSSSHTCASLGVNGFLSLLQKQLMDEKGEKEGETVDKTLKDLDEWNILDVGSGTILGMLGRSRSRSRSPALHML